MNTSGISTTNCDRKSGGEIRAEIHTKIKNAYLRYVIKIAGVMIPMDVSIMEIAGIMNKIPNGNVMVNTNEKYFAAQILNEFQ